MKHKDSYWQGYEFIDELVNQLPAAIFWKDKNSVFLGCNQYFASLAGLTSPKEIIGKTDYDLPWGKHEADQYRKDDQEVMQNKKPKLDIEETQTLSDGRVLTLLTNKIPLFYKDTKEIVGVLCIFHDITDRKKMEFDLRQAIKTAEAAKDKAETAKYIMTEFVSNMGHDLSTPISDIGSVVQILSFYIDEYPEFKELFETLLQRSEDCEKVRQRIIDATSISNLEVKSETFSISQLLLELEKELRPTIGSKNVKLIIKPIKPKKEDWIVTDRVKLHDIIYQLMSNGINFTDEGQVTVSVSKKDNMIHIKVEDTGIGIPADMLDYIFEQYTKLSRSNKYGAAFKGVGAGLYLARILAKLLGATIQVESEIGKGSIFTLSIPAS